MYQCLQIQICICICSVSLCICICIRMSTIAHYCIGVCCTLCTLYVQVHSAVHTVQCIQIWGINQPEEKSFPRSGLLALQENLRNMSPLWLQWWKGPICKRHRDYKKRIMSPSYKGSKSIAISCSTMLVVESKLEQFGEGNRFVLSPLIPVSAPPWPVRLSPSPSMHCENPLPHLWSLFSSHPPLHFPFYRIGKDHMAPIYLTCIQQVWNQSPPKKWV